MLTAEKIQSNWDRYINEINVNISKDRANIVVPFLQKHLVKNLAYTNIFYTLPL